MSFCHQDNNGVDCPFCGHKHQYGATADDYVTCAENSHTCQQLIRSHLRYAFESAAWTAAKLHTVELTKVFRQADAEFVGVLNEIRRGKVSESAKQLLRGCERKLPEDNILVRGGAYTC